MYASSAVITHHHWAEGLLLKSTDRSDGSLNEINGDVNREQGEPSKWRMSAVI